MKIHDSGATLEPRVSAEQELEAAKPAEAKRTAPRPGRLSSTKVHERHVARLAIVYVRQSTAQQMIEHRESLDRQYALTDYALALGWSSDRTLTIDEDLGRSGRSAEGRPGFQRLLAEISMDHVGVVMGLEMSRLARSCKDWHHLLEVCAVFGTLLADQDGVYDPNDPNDRLLLGLRGTISEVELHTMRNRLDRGKLNKAERGELFMCLPIGYAWSPSHEVVMEPDEQARGVVQLILDKFAELGTAVAVFHYLLENDIKTPVRPHDGPNPGVLTWRRPSMATIYGVLHNPIYAGTYAYGRCPIDSMDLLDFAENVDQDGIFRGFPDG
jgi:DNA invertase Pin-like site-specific DNA recombinase